MVTNLHHFNPTIASSANLILYVHISPIAVIEIEYYFIIIKPKKLIMKILKNNYGLFTVIFFLLFSVTFMPTAHAENVYNSFPVSIKYVGGVKNSPIFELSFTNEINQEFQIIITDKFNTLYTENITGKGLVRKFQFVNEELIGSSKDEVTVLNVEIRNLTTNNVITYKINPDSGVQNEVELVAVNY